MCKNMDRLYRDQNVSVPTSNPAVLLGRTMLTVFQWMMLQQFCSWIRHSEIWGPKEVERNYMHSRDFYTVYFTGTAPSFGACEYDILRCDESLLLFYNWWWVRYTLLLKRGEYMQRMTDGTIFHNLLCIFGDINSLLMCGGVFCLLSCILPLGFPYQFLPLLLLGLSVKVKKSEWQVLVGYPIYFFMIWLLMLTEMHEYRCLSAATLSRSPNYCLLIVSQEVVGHESLHWYIVLSEG